MTDREYLKFALDEAMVRRGFCAPNPAVGAVIVRGGKILGRGHHHAPGLAHGEIAALNSLAPGENARGATLYVTLEPCCFFGRTPPCTQRLIQEGFDRVVYAYADPNPKVKGKGREELLRAGMKCEKVDVPEIASFYESYEYWTHTSLPKVTLKLALSLDGKTAFAEGRRAFLTSEGAGKFTHLQRFRADAILTSAKTIEADDPLLNVRLAGECGSPKPLYILDARAGTPLSAKCFAPSRKITVFHGEEASRTRLETFAEKKIRTVLVPRVRGGLCLEKVLQTIGQDGAHDLWVEAGGKLAESFLVEKRVQRAYFYLAPKWLGSEATGAFSNRIVGELETARSCEWRSAGPDAICKLEW